MRGYIGLADFDWYEQLRQSGPSEVNFWRPLSGREFRALDPGDPFFFKLKAAHGSAIAGFGFYAGFMSLTVNAAWDFFRESNGVHTKADMWERIGYYVQRNRGGEIGPLHEIGCIVLTTPCFFPPTHWVAPPHTWKPNIVTGAGLDISIGEGQRIWAACQDRARDLRRGDEALAYNIELSASTVEFRERVSRVRLGQGAFRAVVTSAYRGTCAVSGDHTLPALEASHIRPITQGGPHEIGNGLLLRADIHRLFDQHLVTVTPDHEFLVSPRLREEFANGAIYYALQERELTLPTNDAFRPRREYLEEHRDRFAASA